jgi:hypothetical protein
VVGACFGIVVEGGLLFALVRRYLWAWVACVGLQVLATVILAAANVVGVASAALDVVQVILLLSPQMRTYVRKSSDAPALVG